MIMRIIKAIATRLPLLLSGIAITLLCLASCSLSTLVAGKAITGLVRTQLQPTESKSDTVKAWQDEIKTYPFIKDWRDSLMKANALRDTFITSVDGIKLHAMYVRANPQAEVTAIVIHGHTRSAIAVAHLGYMYSHDFGYNILLPDMRASGLSEGSNYTMGWNESKDAAQWVKAASSLFSDSTKILVHGVSMGAATTIMLSGDSVNNNVKWYVEDCGYSSITDEFKYLMNKDYHVSKASIINYAVKQAKKLYKLDFRKVSPQDFISRCKRPMLFIHGNNDTYVPTQMAQKLYDLKPEPKELWIVDGAGHDEAFKVSPENYRNHIREFLARYKAE
jgi:fermentation-respiration switch protein FrsA (DUF1100 family)